MAKRDTKDTHIHFEPSVYADMEILLKEVHRNTKTVTSYVQGLVLADIRTNGYLNAHLKKQKNNI